jgi:hypothetical protein
MVRDIKEKIRQRTGIPLDQQLLVNKGIELEDYRTVSEYDIDNNSVIDLLLMRFDLSDTNNISVSKRQISIQLTYLAALCIDFLLLEDHCQDRR